MPPNSSRASTVPFVGWFANKRGSEKTVQAPIKTAIKKDNYDKDPGSFAKAVLKAAYLAFEGAGKLDIGLGLVTQLHTHPSIDIPLKKVYDDLDDMRDLPFGGYADALGQFYDARTTRAAAAGAVVAHGRTQAGRGHTTTLPCCHPAAAHISLAQAFFRYQPTDKNLSQ